MITYYNTDKAKIPYQLFKEQGQGYFSINNALLFRPQQHYLNLPFFTIKIDDGNILGIETQDKIINFLKKNTKPQHRSNIGLQLVDNNNIFKLGKWKEKKGKQEKEVNYGYHQYKPQQQLTLAKAKILAVALKTAANPVELESEDWLQLQDMVNENLFPSDIANDFLQEGDFLHNDQLNILLDMKNLKDNISGQPFDVIFRYYKGNIEEIKKYLLKKGFDTDFLQDSDVLYRYELDKYVIEFRTTGVYAIHHTSNGDITLQLTTKPLILKGIFKSYYDLKSKATLDQPKQYYLMELDGLEYIMKYTRNVDQFNNEYGSYGIRYIGTPKFLQLMYEGLDQWGQDKDITDNILVYVDNQLDAENGVFIHGGEVLQNDTNKMILNFAQKYAVETNKKQTTIKKAIEVFDGYYKKPYYYIIYLRLLGAFLKQEWRKHGVNVPLILASGITQSGKTEMIVNIMKLFGYSDKQKQDKQTGIEIPKRIVALELAKPHGLLMQLIENTPIFLDELTGNVNKETDDILRAIFNEQNTPKGTPNLDTKNFVVKSPAIIGGEKLPMKKSVVNRSIYLNFNPIYKGTRENYLKVKQFAAEYSVLDDYYTKVKNAVKKIPEVKQDFLNLGKEDRLNESYSFIRWVNSLFEVVPEITLLKILQDLYKEEVRLLAGLDEEKQFFNKILFLNIKQKIYSFFEIDGDMIVSLYIPDEMSNEYQHYIVKLKELVYDDMDDGDIINVNMTKLFEEQDKDKQWIVQKVIRFFKGVKDIVWQNFLDEKIGQGMIS